MDPFRTPPRGARPCRVIFVRPGRLASFVLGCAITGLAVPFFSARAHPPSDPSSPLPVASVAPFSPVVEPEVPPAPGPPKHPSPAQARATIARQAEAAVRALRAHDSRALAALVDRDRGLGVSPLGPEPAPEVLTHRQLLGCLGDRAARWWGSPGAGGDIVLRCGAYWSEYLDDADYAAAGNVAYDEAPSYGESRDDMDSLPEGSIFVDYFVPGALAEDEAHPGKPWRSLTLVFEAIGEDWRLTRVVHQAEDDKGC